MLFQRSTAPTPPIHTIGLLRRVYRAPCADNEALRNPVELWQAGFGRPGGGRFNKRTRRKIGSPADILPKWYKGFEAVQNTVIRDALYVGLYTGMRTGEVFWLKWSDIRDGELIVEETKTGETTADRQRQSSLARRLRIKPSSSL